MKKITKKFFCCLLLLTFLGHAEQPKKMQQKIHKAYMAGINGRSGRHIDWTMPQARSAFFAGKAAHDEILNNHAQITGRPAPSFFPLITDKKAIFRLQDSVSSRIIDSNTGERYIKLYHGTTTQFLKTFQQGAQAIRFDKATKAGLGKGFYVTSSFKEATYYGHDHVRWVAGYKPMIVVIGVRENVLIEGRNFRQHSMSDFFGNSLNEGLYFLRKPEAPTQFIFFSNIAPYLKVFALQDSDGCNIINPQLII